MEKGKNYITFFDLDKTIISLNSGSMLVRQAYKNGVMNTGNLISALFQAWLYKFNLRDTNLIISRMGTWLKGVRNEDIEKLSNEVIEKYLKNSIRPEILEEIILHKERKARMAILSSAISTICEPIAAYLGIDEIICTKMEVENGVLTGNPIGSYCFGDEKRVRLLSYCEENNCDPGTAWYYADSISDLNVLEVVGHPVCVSPDSRLSRVARKRNWRII